MTPVVPRYPHANAHLVVFVVDQPEYNQIPAFIDENGVVMTEWALSDEDVIKLFENGHIRLWVHTFNQPLQPISLEIADVVSDKKADS